MHHKELLLDYGDIGVGDTLTVCLGDFLHMMDEIQISIKILIILLILKVYRNFEIFRSDFKRNPCPIKHFKLLI